MELGCWGPVVQCNIAERGVIDGHGGCMSMGGICIGCTMPGFPDKFSHSERDVTVGRERGLMTRVEGSFMRRLDVAAGRARRTLDPMRAATSPPRRPGPHVGRAFFRSPPRS